MKYVEIKIGVSPEHQEQLIADLASLGFTGFQQLDDILLGYIGGENFSQTDIDQLEQQLKVYSFEAGLLSWRYIEEENWNDAWEQTLTPQFVGKFFIKPSWSEIEPPSDTTLLKIDPKMSFGTGYHETTRLMLRKIPDIIEEGDKVLDAGTGTGILAIAAAKMGAEWVFGFDIDEWSYQNASENITLNEVEDQVTLAKGDEQVIPDDVSFDVIIANINRSVIIPMLPRMMGLLKMDGSLVLSGLTQSDHEKVEENEIMKQFTSLLDVTEDGEWICMHYRKTSEEAPAGV